jgi:HNH endonuclease
MRYLLQRVVHNEARWTRPTQGRLKSPLDGGYVSKYGFAQEDWIFSDDSIGGHCYGYSSINVKFRNEPYNIAYATYDSGGIWSLVGFYENAMYDENGSNLSKKIFDRRAKEVRALRATGDLGGEYLNASLPKIKQLLRQELVGCWKVLLNDVRVLAFPIHVPKEMIPKNVSLHFGGPTYISERNFDALRQLAPTLLNRTSGEDYVNGGDIEFPEGRGKQQRHFSRERSRRLVQLAKARFKTRYGRFYCEACKFDFAENYGDMGDGFIEAHHNVPVSELKAGAKTKVSELSLICSNCHRMIHRRRPWLSVAKLRELIRKRAP